MARIFRKWWSVGHAAFFDQLGLFIAETAKPVLLVWITTAHLQDIALVEGTSGGSIFSWGCYMEPLLHI